MYEDGTKSSGLSTSKMVANSNVKQIFVKSPPPPVQTPAPPLLSTQPQPQLQQASSAISTDSEAPITSTTIVQPTGANLNHPEQAALDDTESGSNIKSVLEAREAHVLKLNKQNVELQEENDNLLNEIEKVIIRYYVFLFFFLNFNKIYFIFF